LESLFKRFEVKKKILTPTPVLKKTLDAPPRRRFGDYLGTFDNVKGLLPESQGQNLALTVLFVPHSLDSGSGLEFGDSG
jgi:hypothetical protein